MDIDTFFNNITDCLISEGIYEGIASFTVSKESMKEIKMECMKYISATAVSSNDQLTGELKIQHGAITFVFNELK